MATPKQTDPQFKLRMPLALRSAIEAAAATNNRSMNAEMIARLEAHDTLRYKIAELVEERDKGAAQIDAYRDAIEDQRGIIASLQRLTHDRLKASQQDDETLQEIQNRFNELKSQSDYLETLKAELIDLVREREAITADKDRLLEEQSAALQRVSEDLKEAFRLVGAMRGAFVKAGKGDMALVNSFINAFGNNEADE